MSALIKCEDISFSYSSSAEIPEEENHKVTVFENLNIDIKKGQLVCVLGHNGSGKSTLAKHFNAILLPGSGTVYVNGMNTAEEDNTLSIRSTVGMVFQNPDNQLVATIVEEDVAFGLENMGVEPALIRQRVDEALDTVNMLKYKTHAPHQLSGGQKQRIAIAGVIAMRPGCIVLDEPTAMLDPRGRAEVMNTIKALREHFGITVVLITHYMDEAAKADRVVVMDNGKIILDDNPYKVFSNVALLKSIGLDVPQATELAYLVRKAGFKIKEDILTPEECISAILSLKTSE